MNKLCALVSRDCDFVWIGDLIVVVTVVESGDELLFLSSQLVL